MLIDIRWLRFLLNHWRNPAHTESAVTPVAHTPVRAAA